MIGIYKIFCKSTGRVYIGSSSNVEYRLTSHKYALRTNTHSNKLMQEDYNKYGLDMFDFSIIEECDDNMKFEREKYYMEDVYKCLNTDTGYNRMPIHKVGCTYKQHVPKTYLCNSDIELIKFMLAIDVPINAISKALSRNYMHIKQIRELYNYQYVCDRYNYYMLHPSARNIVYFINTDIMKKFVEIYNDKLDLLFRYCPIIPFKDIEDIVSVNIEKVYYPIKGLHTDYTNHCLFQSDIDYIFSISNELESQILFFMILNSTVIGNHCISYFSEIQFITVFGKLSQHKFINAIRNLILNKIISISTFNMGYKLNLKHCGSVVIEQVSVQDTDLLYERIKNMYFQLKQTIGICKYCGKLFRQGKTKRANYCHDHRGYIKKLNKRVPSKICANT